MHTLDSPPIDDNGMMNLAGAVVALAAADYIQGRRDCPSELPAVPFLEAAGVLERAAEIVAYSPRCAASRGRKGKGTGERRQNPAPPIAA